MPIAHEFLNDSISRHLRLCQIQQGGPEVMIV